MVWHVTVAPERYGRSRRQNPFSGASMSAPARTVPNILVTGSPGTGKTSFSESLAEELGLRHVNVGALV